MAAKKSTTKSASVGTKSVLAKLQDGTVQLTLTIPQAAVDKKREESLKKLVAEIEVPGFRKGKVPQDTALKQIEQQKLYEHMLQFLLPEAYSKAAQEHNLRPILAPRFELVSVKDGEDWQVRAITCELPSVDVKDYKKALKGKGRPKIVLPKNEKSKQSADTTRAQQEQDVIKILLDTTEASIPDILLEEEVNHKLTGLIDQLQKVGLTIERYLAQTGKTAERVKEEYKRRSQEAIKLELVLNTIARDEQILVGNDEIETVVASMKDDPGAPQDKEQTRRIVRSVLLQRKTLDKLISYL